MKWGGVPFELLVGYGGEVGAIVKRVDGSMGEECKSSLSLLATVLKLKEGFENVKRLVPTYVKVGQERSNKLATDRGQHGIPCHDD